MKKLLSRNSNLENVIILGNGEFRESFNIINRKIIFINIDELENPSSMIYKDFHNFSPFEYQKFRDISKLLPDSFTRLGSLYYDIHNVEISILKLYLFFRSLIEKYSIDLFLSFSVPHFPPHLTLFYCMEVMNKKNLYVWHTGLDNIVYISSSLENSNSLYIHPKEIRIKNIHHITNELLELIKLKKNPKELTPLYMKNLSYKRLSFLMASTVSRTKLLILRNESLVTLMLSHMLRNSLQGGKKFLKFIKKVAITEIPFVPYVYIPLHMQPEATTLPMGREFHRLDLYLITILNYIPNDFLLIVKENPKQTFRSRNNQYIELLKKARFNVISSNTDTYSLIRNSELIITITGTVALEASLLGKKTVVFGNTPYKYLPNTFSFSEDSKLMEKFLSVPASEVNIASFKNYIDEISKTAFISRILSESKTNNESDIINTAETLSIIIDYFKSN